MEKTMTKSQLEGAILKSGTVLRTYSRKKIKQRSESQPSKEDSATTSREQTKSQNNTNNNEVSDHEDTERSQPKTPKKKRTLSAKRKRSKITILPRANNASAYEATWSELDKQRLLIALQRFGVLEIDELINAVPGKSEADIRKYISLKWKMARVELRAHLKEVRKSKGDRSRYLGPVDNWLEVINANFPNYDHYKTNPIAHAVLLIWKYEKHPRPSECGGVDFKALYEYLYYCLCGYPPKHLNQPTAAFLADTLKNFAYRIKNEDWSEEMKFLSKPLKLNTEEQPPVSEEDVIKALSFTKEQCLDELAKVPGFNPFSVPRELLQRKVPASSSPASPAESATSARSSNTTFFRNFDKPGTSKD